MGGRGSKSPPLTCADLCALCAECNRRAEADLQQVAILCGWKIKRHTQAQARDIPVYDRVTGNWWVLHDDGTRTRVSLDKALGLMNKVYGD